MNLKNMTIEIIQTESQRGKKEERKGRECETETETERQKREGRREGMG